MIIDTHTHIYDEKFDEDRDLCVERAILAGVERFIMPAVDSHTHEKMFKVADDFNHHYPTIGVHPTSIKEDYLRELEVAENFLVQEKNRIVAIGEIGLDYYWDKENIDKQKEYFIKQIKLANKLDLPMIIHSRDAALDTYDILKEYDKNGKGIIHCYSSSYQMAQMFIKLGYLISLAGPVTFKNALVPKDVAKNIDLKNLLIETDSPYLTPHPNRGKRNDSSNVVYIAQMIAELKEIDVLEVMEQTTKNYYDLFNTKK